MVDGVWSGYWEGGREKSMNEDRLKSSVLNLEWKSCGEIGRCFNSANNIHVSLRSHDWIRTMSATVCHFEPYKSKLARRLWLSRRYTLTITIEANDFTPTVLQSSFKDGFSADTFLFAFISDIFVAVWVCLAVYLQVSMHVCLFVRPFVPLTVSVVCFLRPRI